MKRWKVVQLVGACVAVGSIPLCVLILMVAGNAPARGPVGVAVLGCFVAAMIGLLVFAVGRFGAWWSD